jgi:hypothetical protein
MTNTIVVQDGSGGSTVPVLVLGYEAEQSSRNIVHDTLDGGIMVSLIPPRPRSGTLRLFYPSEAAADAARLLHRRPAPFTLTSTERTTINMSYVTAGPARIVLDDQTRNAWVVEVGFQEVTI